MFPCTNTTMHPVQKENSGSIAQLHNDAKLHPEDCGHRFVLVRTGLAVIFLGQIVFGCLSRVVDLIVAQFCLGIMKQLTEYPFIPPVHNWSTGGNNSNCSRQFDRSLCRIMKPPPKAHPGPASAVLYQPASSVLLDRWSVEEELSLEFHSSPSQP